MSYRTLLLHLDDHDRADACVDYAARLARAFDARLLGLSCHRPAPWPGDGAVAIVGGDPLTTELKAAEDAAQTREAAFVARCRKAGLRSFETVREDDEPVAAVVAHALTSDLVLVGQAQPDAPGYAERRARVDAILQQSARPVLVLPYAGTFEPPFPGRVLVAWDDSPGAARAAAAALPLLARAGIVHLVHLQHPRHVEDGAARLGLNRAAAWLSRHGLEVHARVSANEIPVGEALLTEAADVGAQLVVMGAWSHRPVVERLLGGVTRTLVDSMTVPVVFAH